MTKSKISGYHYKLHSNEFWDDKPVILYKSGNYKTCKHPFFKFQYDFSRDNTMSHIYFYVGNNLTHIEYNSTLHTINIKHSWQYVQCKLQFDMIYTW